MKKFETLLLFMLVASASTVSLNQVPAPSGTPDVDDVVKITTKLVQVDVVVTDKKGNQVRDLRPGDFELLQDGKPQQIVGMTYVSLEELSAAKPEADAPPVRSGRNAGANRIIALVVDDGICATSITGINTARDGIKRFINEGMGPRDYIAIYQTRVGSSMLQQYTNDKAALLRAAEKIRWRPPVMGGCGHSDGSFNEPARPYKVTNVSPNEQFEPEAERKIREYREDSVANRQVVGTLGVVRYALRGLERAPGRKMMFLFSDALAFRSRSNETLSAQVALRELTEAANRAGVVVNTLWLRGSDVPGMIEARDDVVGLSRLPNVNITAAISDARIADARRNQDGLATLAYDTGGEYFRGSGRLNVPMTEILRRETGYYLLAYEPADESFKNKRFNKIEVKVNSPDLRVVHRAGYVGVQDAELTNPKRKSADSELYEAITAPLPKAGLAVSMIAHYGRSAQAGDFVRAMFHINGSQLLFSTEPNGQKKAVLDVVAVTVDEKNDIVDDFKRTHTLKFDAATAERIVRDGLVYSTDVPVKKSGNYNFRVAVRDNNSKQIGSAAQVVDIPDLKRSGIFLSGLAVSGADDTGKFQRPEATTAVDAIDVPASPAVPAIRRFKRGSVIAYSYSIYNARPGKDGGKPNLTVQVRLYRNGILGLEGPAKALLLDGNQDIAKIDNYGYISLVGTEPGEYTLELIVHDPTAGKNPVSSQWIDYEVID